MSDAGPFLERVHCVCGDSHACGVPCPSCLHSPMISCDACLAWLHLPCLALSDLDIPLHDTYTCPACSGVQARPRGIQVETRRRKTSPAAAPAPVQVHAPVAAVEVVSRVLTNGHVLSTVMSNLSLRTLARVQVVCAAFKSAVLALPTWSGGEFKLNDEGRPELASAHAIHSFLVPHLQVGPAPRAYDLNYCMHVGRPELCALLACTPPVSLSLRGCVAITDEAFKFSSAGSPTRKRRPRSLPHCDAALNLSHLTYLDVSITRVSLSLDCVAQLAARAHSLQVLIADFNSIPPATVTALAGVAAVTQSVVHAGALAIDLNCLSPEAKSIYAALGCSDVADGDAVMDTTRTHRPFLSLLALSACMPLKRAHLPAHVSIDMHAPPDASADTFTHTRTVAMLPLAAALVVRRSEDAVLQGRPLQHRDVLTQPHACGYSDPSCVHAHDFDALCDYLHHLPRRHTSAARAATPRIVAHIVAAAQRAVGDAAAAGCGHRRGVCCPCMHAHYVAPHPQSLHSHVRMLEPVPGGHAPPRVEMAPLVTPEAVDAHAAHAARLLQEPEPTEPAAALRFLLARASVQSEDWDTIPHALDTLARACDVADSYEEASVRASVHLYTAWLCDKAYRWVPARAHVMRALEAMPHCGSACEQLAGLALQSCSTGEAGAANSAQAALQLCEQMLDRAESCSHFLPGSYHHVFEQRAVLRMREGFMLDAMDALIHAMRFAPARADGDCRLAAQLRRALMHIAEGAADDAPASEGRFPSRGRAARPRRRTGR